MKPHLSDDEFAGWVLGERAAAQLEHVADCATCRSEAVRLSGALSGFRQAAHQWAAETQPVVCVRQAPQRLQARPKWALATAALALLVAVPLYQRHSASTRERAAREAAADTALLKQVDIQISKAVPEPLEPLLALVSWNSGSALEK